MSENNIENLEQRLYAVGQGFPYPPTPDLATAVHEQLEAKNARRAFPRTRLAWVLAILILLGSIAFAVPPVRAQILEFLQIGGMRVFFGETTQPEASAIPEQTSTIEPGAIPGGETQITTPLAAGLPAVQDLVEPTTLQAAQAQSGFSLKVPAYPQNLGLPDQVYSLDLEGPAVLLLWMEPDAPQEVALSLLQLGPGAFAGKGAPGTVEQVEVSGEPGLWMEGQHMLYLHLGENYKNVQIPVEGKILIWTEGSITYRLEGAPSLEEALRIAESLENLR